MHEVNDMKAERVQIWGQVVAATRSIFSRIYGALEWAEGVIGALKPLFFGRDQMKR